jgi:hypothetical protein
MSDEQTLHETLERIFREQSHHTNLIETLWLLYASAVAIPSGGAQWVESRRAFFAGASTLFEAIYMILDPGTETSEADLVRVNSIAEELDRFHQEIRDGRS